MGPRNERSGVEGRAAILGPQSAVHRPVNADPPMGCAGPPLFAVGRFGAAGPGVTSAFVLAGAVAKPSGVSLLNGPGSASEDSVGPQPHAPHITNKVDASYHHTLLLFFIAPMTFRAG